MSTDHVVGVIEYVYCTHTRTLTPSYKPATWLLILPDEAACVAETSSSQAIWTIFRQEWHHETAVNQPVMTPLMGCLPQMSGH